MEPMIALLLALAWVVMATGWLRLHPVIALLLAALGYGLLTAVPAGEIVGHVGAGFGATIGYIGPIILLGSIIGVFLERSGAAARLARLLMRGIGWKRVTIGMGGMGLVVSVPVFCDSGFILLSPLNHAAARESNGSVVPGALALALGLYAGHTMVPPTPGPIAAAELLGADLGFVMLLGLPIALLTTCAGAAYAHFVGRRAFIAPDAMPPEPASMEPAGDKTGPSIGKALAPVALPIVLICLGTLVALPSVSRNMGDISAIVAWLGQPIIALGIGALAALALPDRLTRDMLSESGWIGDAIRDCAVIILITGAGGAFGRVLAESGIASSVSGIAGIEGLGLLLPLLIAAAIKTGQGSSTVAIITTAGLTAPLLPSLGLESDMDRALATIAIGAGAMAISHVNDSFFWVVSRLSNMSTRQALTLYSPGTLVQAVAASIAVVTASALLG
ncbi:GntP family permease [Aurantiacibacter gangjinensis]|uniref:Uncharacterized protein n=1 Tax=Aurantiacibacter gangjinensis TaxID=502682 RepID=A0A0G9ML21_9SPHN|nr:GntP family permease [Aurantiacibacter gangjinensis]APE27171.1 D-glycerate transporter (predicted) [Aurantiacibacter gangjinensis]KLE31309.1 hypothetical protein AAW01_06730 [Aurantiacibacter gangjinensis]